MYVLDYRFPLRELDLRCVPERCDFCFVVLDRLLTLRLERFVGVDFFVKVVVVFFLVVLVCGFFFTTVVLCFLVTVPLLDFFTVVTFFPPTFLLFDFTPTLFV